MMLEASSIQRIKAVTRKEFYWYLNSPGGFILIAIFVGFANFLFFKDFFVNANADMRSYFTLLPWLLIFLTAGISMRTFAEENRAGTIEVLLSLPLTETELVLGKFLASLTFIATSLLASLTVPITLSFLGKPDFGQIVTGYIGVLLASSSMISIGIFISSLSKNQVVSLLSTVLILFLLLVTGEDLILQQVPKFTADIFSFMGINARLFNFSRGVIDLRDLVYFLTTSAGFIFLAVKVTENRD